MILFQTLKIAADQNENPDIEKEEKSQKPTELSKKIEKQDTNLEVIERNSKEGISKPSTPEIISVDTTQLNKVL